MIIVFVIDNYCAPTNGTIMTAIRFAEGLRKRGHTVRIVSNNVEGEDMYGVKERVIPIVSAVSAKNDIAYAKYEESILREAFEGADLVHFFMPWQLAVESRKLAERMGIAVTAAYHCQPENVTYNLGLGRVQFVADYLYDRFRKKFYKHIESIHCPSEFIANQLVKYDYHSKMYVISNGVSDYYVPESEEARNNREYNIENKDVFNITMIGRLAPEKRQDLIIDAVNNSKYRDKIQLTFAGKGPQEKRLEKQAEDVDLPLKPVFGFYSQDEVLKLLYRTDLYVHASDIEIEGISCIEAFSAGRVPVISNAKLSATPQFALDDRSLFEQGNYMDLAAKIDYWIEHPEERKAMETEYAALGDKYRLDYSIVLAEQMFKDAISDNKAKKLIADKKCRNITRRATTKLTAHQFFGGMLYYGLAAPVLIAVTRLFQGLKIVGKENFKKTLGYGAVTVSNHVHTLDSPMIGNILLPHKPKFVSLPSNFKLPVAGMLVEMLGAVPIPTTPSENRVFFYLLGRNLSKGKFVHFFPEGHLEPGNEGIRPFKRGAFHLAVSSRVPVVPVRFVFRERKGLYKLFGKKKCITAIIGEPIFPDQKLSKEEAVNALKTQTEQAMRELGK